MRKCFFVLKYNLMSPRSEVKSGKNRNTFLHSARGNFSKSLECCNLKTRAPEMSRYSSFLPPLIKERKIFFLNWKKNIFFGGGDNKISLKFRNIFPHDSQNWRTVHCEVFFTVLVFIYFKN